MKLGHVLRHENFLHDIIEGKTTGLRGVGKGVIARYSKRLWTVEQFNLRQR